MKWVIATAAIISSALAGCDNNDGIWIGTTTGYVYVDCEDADDQYLPGEDARWFCSGDEWVGDNPDYGSCIVKTCGAEGIWGAVDVETDATADCTSVDAVIYTAGTATRTCENNPGAAAFASPDVSACTAITCSEDLPWVETTILSDAILACDAYDGSYSSGNAVRTCENDNGVATWGTVDESNCAGAPKCVEAPWPEKEFGESAALDCATFDPYSYQSGEDATRECVGTAETPVWSVTDASACVELPEGSASQAGQPTYSDPNLDVTGVDMYPGNYYINLVEGDDTRQFHLGHIPCPGETVCVPNWIGNGHCDDCFGCDPFMVASGMFGDCSTCDYFWSSGTVGKGVFDGGDCDDFVFPSAIVEDLFGQCLTSGGFRTTAQLVGVKYRQQRNIIISELVNGGWGDVNSVQESTDMQLVALCQYANLTQCLIKNGWWNENMSSWEEGDLHFEAATWIEDFTTYRSIELVDMSKADVLEQCAVSGLHQKISEFEWIETNTLNAMTADQKRNHVITRLYNSGIGTAPQLQSLSNSQLRMILDFFDVSSAPSDSA